MRNSSRCARFALWGLLAAGLLMVSSVVWAGDGVQASPQSAVSATAQVQSTTTLVPQNQVVYETVYDVETVQVPVTVNQTQYRTECRTQTVPVTRTVVEQVPVTVNQQ